MKLYLYIYSFIRFNIYLYNLKFNQVILDRLQNRWHSNVLYLYFSSKQEIKVVIKPWIRIDGVLNRRVFDRMLGSILSYCLTHPGIALSKIQNRFVPALQPCHTRELIEVNS